jgi:hypothetical protein
VQQDGGTLTSETKIPENLVDEFSNLICKYIDTPKVFADAVGFAMSSALLGPAFKSLWVPHGTANLFIVLSSLPGRTRRSTVQEAFEKVFKRVRKMEMFEKAKDDFLNEELNRSENKDCTQEQIRNDLSDEDLLKIEEKIEDEINNMIIEEGSTEGLIDHIENTNSNEFIITSREMGAIFQKIFKEGYEQGVGLLFSKLYYGEGSAVYLSSRGGKKGGRKIRPDLYVTMLGGMQEFRLYITEDAVRQGLARRIIIVYVPKATEWKPPINEDRANFDDELNSFADKVLERRKYLRDCIEKNGGRTIDAIIHPKVESEINDFDHKLAMKLDASPTLENIAIQSRWEHLFKLSFCYEIAKNRELRGSEDSGFHVLITPDSYDRAKAFLDVVDQNSKGEIDSISDVSDKSVNIRVPTERLYSLAVQKGPSGIRVTELLQATHWRSKYAFEMALELKQQGRLRIESRQGKTKPSTYFIAIPEDQREEGNGFVVPK